MWRLREWSGLILIAGLVGCSHAAEVPGSGESTGLHLPSGIAQIGRPTVTIQELSPQQQNDTLQIEGTVGQQAPLLAGSMYQLQDDSGTIWVLSDEAAPAASSSVRVVGTLQVEPIRVEGIDISDFYVRERDRQLFDRAPAAEDADTGDADPVDTEIDSPPPDGSSEE